MGIELANNERIQVWISPKLKDVLAAIQKEVALDIKLAATNAFSNDWFFNDKNVIE